MDPDTVYLDEGAERRHDWEPIPINPSPIDLVPYAGQPCRRRGCEARWNFSDPEPYGCTGERGRHRWGMWGWGFQGQQRVCLAPGCREVHHRGRPEPYGCTGEDADG